MNARALHGFFHGIESKWHRGRDARMFHARQTSELLANNAIKILGPCSIETTQARIDFNEKGIVGMQSGLDRSRFRGTANKKRGGCDQREGESDLHHDERIARQKFPTSTAHVLAGLLFQISDHGRARELERGSERKAKCAQNTEYQSRSENHRIWAAQPNDVDRQNGAE